MPSPPKWSNKFQLHSGSWVFVPTRESKVGGRIIKRCVEGCWSAPNYYYHLRQGGHVEAIRSHTSGQFFIHLDICQFFSSINRSRITRSLKSRLGYERAREIAIASTVPAPNTGGSAHILPYGFVQSPILASICLRYSKLGSALHELSKAKKTTVSVYVDDIIISTQSLTEAEDALGQVKGAAERSGFPLNSDKEEGPAQKITAFNIELSHSKLRINDRRMSLFLRNYMEAVSEYQQDGIVGYIETVNPEQADFSQICG
ncbi:reverse transcriptase domain-containing protein [Endozoicomonas sp. SESOKO1]|uniref:reverse transcriptase domain-containing protein n=1 Tax=Endozoicomonas sp. SESOKO1 TaxID=2828742 RepID=UPI0021483E32|nr:reverse transcriptase domain-containing protein [Endozoicomonas sp. SESOKO1]